ncbi:hypothetical protein KYY02_32520 [Streptomyces pimonensis]|uniref:Integral-membrane protein n=1 Tax=Streptomyces pimonensis TaxID=2860288 RepID=A0ABV4J8H4_9ACTN
MDAGWCARTVRAAVFAAVCVLLAALGHTMMSDCSVPRWALMAGAVVTGGVGWALAGRERGPALIVSLVVVAQTVLHWGFSLAQSAVRPTTPSAADGGMDSMGHDVGSMDMSGMGAHLMHMHSMGMSHASHSGPGSEAGPGHWLANGVPSFGMSVAHLLAAVLCGLWLGYGERVAYRLLRAVAGWLAAPLRLTLSLPALPRRPRRLVRRSRSRWVPHPLRLVHAITTRGPPSTAAVV